jgi:hypothetical protein
LQSSFRESQLDTKTLPEDQTSSEDPSVSEEAWFRLKTWFVWVQALKKSAIGADLAIALRPASFGKAASFAPQAIASIHPNWALILCHLRKLSFKCRFEICEGRSLQSVDVRWMVIAH